jgi:hypothetical protein
MLYFFGRVLVAIPITLGRYRKEFFRNLSDMGWGNGSTVVGGGTVGVAIVLGITAGALLAVEGYNTLNLLGLGAATGLLSSWGSTRELVPVMIALAFTTQAGCRFTAQLGAMRISEEIDTPVEPDRLGAEIREQHPAERRRSDTAELHDAETGERSASPPISAHSALYHVLSWQ